MVVIIDAALVRILHELLNAILETKGKNEMFYEVLDRMQSTLDSVIPIANEIAMLNKELDAGKPDAAEKLMDHIKKGQEIVRKCSESSGCSSCFKKPRYAEKLVALEKSIQTFCQIVMQVQQTRDQKEILKDVKKIHRQLNPADGDGSILSCSVPAATKIIVGLDGPVEYLKNKLLNDQGSIMVISAPEGYGKTTLAQKFCRDEEVEEKFRDNIFFVNVSKKPTLRVIVRSLLQYKGYSDVPEFHSDEDAAQHLEQFLKEVHSSPILLVLDDVRPESDQSQLLDNLKFQIPNYKILVTSTSVFPRFGSTYKLQPLNNEDSMTLFRYSAFPDGRDYIQDGDLVNKIVEACSGVPLALTVVGKSLSGQDAVIWQRRVMELSKGGPIFESNTDLHNRLKRSLEVLDAKFIVKECYMDLGLFPERQRIPATALVDMWAELYELNEDGVDSIAILHEFDTLNLINLEVSRKYASESDGYYNSLFVMQNGILRQLVNDQNNLEPVEQRKRLIVDASGKKPPKWWREQKNQSVDARLLSITTDETSSPNRSSLQATEVEALVLNCRTKIYELPEFIDKMNKLKVLILINHGFLPAELTNFGLLGSLSNLKRVRLENMSVPSLDWTSLQLEHLRKISLVTCRIGQAFSNTGLQAASALPNLMEINIDSCNDLRNIPVWFCDLVQLKKLCIINCSELSEVPQEIERLENLEVLRLCSCKGLVKLPGTIKNLSKLKILDISDCARIDELPKQFGELHNLRKLLMNGCSSISKLPPSVQNLESLKEVRCDEAAAKLWQSAKHFNKFLSIKVNE